MHYSVLKNEVLENLNIKNDGIYVDATIGYAGHASKILSRVPSGFLYGFDQDKKAVAYANEKLSKLGQNFKIFSANFASLKTIWKENNLPKVDGILFDLGFSSPQIDDASRGFSFMHSGPLDMRMSEEGKSAKGIIDTYSLDNLTKIFFEYGEEKMSRVIAKEIKKNHTSINETLELVECIKKACGASYFYKNHPERKIFQALRIEVNDELKVLEEVLPDAINILNKGGRIAVITFHSLEDRIVKNIFKKYSEVDPLVKGLKDIPDAYKPLIKVINKKVILPSKKELEENSRSKSAKLRVIERI